jgi:hypothetical protein
MSAAELTLYEQIVPEDHFLRRLPQAVDFESFRPLLTSATAETRDDRLSTPLPC